MIRTSPQRMPATLVAITLLLLPVIGWSYHAPHDRFTWWLESFPVAVVLPILWITASRFPFSSLVYALIGLHSVILLVGAHYTYAEVPLFDHLRDLTGGSRNNYDKLGHFAQGFVPAMVLRELLLRTSPLTSGKWLGSLIVLSCLGGSALYELLEWWVAAGTGTAADAFLGTQGDPWDTQKDMMLAGIGAISALTFLSRRQDKAIEKISGMP